MPLGAVDVSLTPAFTWDCSGTVDGFEFWLATDPDYSAVVVSFSAASVLTDTSWACDAPLEPDTNYFWRVRSVRGDAVGSWVEGSFTSGSPALPSPAPADVVIDVPQQSSSVSDYLLWAIFALAVVLLAGLIALILRTAPR